MDESLQLAELLERHWQRLVALVAETRAERGLPVPPALRRAMAPVADRPPVWLRALLAELRGEDAGEFVMDLADLSISSGLTQQQDQELANAFERGAVRLLVEQSRDEPAIRGLLEQAIRSFVARLESVRTCALADEAARTKGLLERLYDVIGDAVLIADPATGGVLRANRAAEELFGISAEQLRWMFVKDLLPHLAETWDELVALEDEDALVRLDAVVAAPEGESRSVQVVAGKLRQAGGEIIHVALHDVTAQVRLRRQLESLADDLRSQVADQIKELEAQRTFFESLLDAVPLRVIVLDRNLRVVHANPAYYLPRGSTKAEIVGRRLEEVFPRQILTAAGLEQAIRSSMETKRQVRWSGYRMATPEHQERLVDIRLDPCAGIGDEMCVLMTIEDVTARHRQLYERTILQQILRAMLEARDLDRLLHAILTGMTAGGSAGLGFNRAFLLLVDEDGAAMRGKLAVGPESKEQAYQIWSEVGQEYQTIEDFMKDYDRTPAPERRPLVDTVARMVFDLADTEHLPVSAAARAETVHVTRASSDPRVTPLLLDLLRVEEFVVAPMMVKGKVVGVAVADNFVTSQPIGEDDIALLTALASHAALAIDTARTHELERQQARELEQAYEKLRGAQQQLVRSKQLAAIGEMAAIVAHEIRNPLSTIGGFARLLQRHPSDAERVKRNSRIIREEVERLERILEDLLELSRPEELKIEECDVGGLVCDVAEMARSDPKATQIEIRTDVEDDVPRVPADPALVREVMVNLIRNGLEAMHAGGTLTLRARRTENGAAIDVSDTGEGIPPERLDTIFEAFVTTKPTGTGLGLARSRKIIEQHGAKLTVESQPGVGSTFSIFFPKDALPPVTAAGADGADTGQGD
jgi:hypothetical protein